MKNQNGNPVANATVEAWGYSAPTVAQAKDDLTSLSDPTPAEFTEQLETGFQLTGQSGFFDSQSVEYAAISSAARFPGEGVSYLGTDFGVDPLWRNIEPGQRVVLTSWDPTNPRNSGLENDLPGQTTDTPVVVEQIDALNGTVDRKIYELDQSVTDYGVDWNWRKEVHYNVTSSLTTGYYRVYPKGHVESAYFVEVGDPGLTIEQLRSAIDDALTPKAQEVVNGLASGDLVRQRVVTNAQGEFSVSLSPSLKAVHLQAYKRPERLENIAREDLSLTDIRNFTEDGYNGSVVLPSRPVTVEPPDSSVELRVGEFSLPSYTPLNRSELKQKWLDEFLSNLNYSDLNGVLQNSPGNFTREELERLNQRLQQLVSQNDQLRNRFRDLCGEEYRLNDDTCDIVVESSNATTEELRTRIDDLSTTLDGLRETIESGTGEFTRGNETISWTKPFGTELDPENVLVLIHYTNGTTDTLTTDSPYVSIDSRLGRGDQVVIDQLPLGDAAGAGIEVIVANQDGIGSARRSVTNPAFSGEVPGIESLAFSSLNPGPSESVTLDLNPTEDSSIQNLSSITVYGPDGSTVPASVTGRNHASFDTDGKGIYQVRAQFQDLDGNNFTLVQRLKAGDLDVKLPPGIRAESTPYGTIAVVGDGLEGGSVDVQDGGASIRLVAQAPSSSEIPSEVHAYTETLSLLSNHRTTVSVVQGDEQSSVGKHVATVLHEPAVDPSGEGLTNFAPLFYRNDAPLPTGSSEKGIVDLNESRTRIETYTDSNGQVTIRTIEEPGIIQWARYQADSIDIPFL